MYALQILNEYALNFKFLVDKIFLQDSTTILAKSCKIMHYWHIFLLKNLLELRFMVDASLQK